MKKILPVFLILVAGALFLSLIPVHVLRLSEKDRPILTRIVRPGAFFELGYLHSVERNDVWDRFTIDGGYRIVLIETRFQGQAAGFPAGLAEGERLTRDGPWFRISGMNREMPAIHWRVQAEWQNRFSFENEKEKNLSSVLGDSLILIRVEKTNFLIWLRCKIRWFLVGRTTSVRATMKPKQLITA